MSRTPSDGTRWRLGRRRDAPEDRALTASTISPALIPYATSGQAAVLPTNALAVADVFACVRALSDAAASIPLVSYRKTASGRTRVAGALGDLLRQPAPATTQANLVGQAVAHLNLYGNAYLGKFRDADGKIEQLALLHPDCVAPELRAGRPVYTVSDGRGRQSEHGVEDVIHIRALSTDGLLGLSPVRQCRVALGLSQSLAQHAAAFFENGARPSGILKVPNDIDPDELIALRASWSQRHTGTANAHRTAIVSGDVAFDAITGPLDDLQFVEQRHLSTAEIARIFRVPPWMVGASSGDSMTYSNVEQQTLAFVTYSLRPWLVLIEQAVSEDADLCRGSLYVEFLLDALLRADSRTRADVYTAALSPDTGWMNRAEVRRLENLDPEPDGPQETTA
jgi:HK97 family phage portal protein